MRASGKLCDIGFDARPLQRAPTVLHPNLSRTLGSCPRVVWHGLVCLVNVSIITRLFSQ